MAWIESHQKLRNHPKTKRLARELGISVPTAIGHLHCLWWWATDYAPDGDLSNYEDWEIADAAYYEGKDCAKFEQALIAAGFIDNAENSGLILHDWNDYAGKNIRQREKERLRSAQRRAQKTAGFLPDDRKKTESANRIEEPVDRKTTKKEAHNNGLDKNISIAS